MSVQILLGNTSLLMNCIIGAKIEQQFIHLLPRAIPSLEKTLRMLDLLIPNYP